MPVFKENELTLAPTLTLFVTKALLPTPKFNELKLEAYMKLVDIVLVEILPPYRKLVLIVPADNVNTARAPVTISEPTVKFVT